MRMYALLADMGFISDEDLLSYRVKGGKCEGHVDEMVQEC